MRAAGGGGNPLPAPFTYDLVNGAREVLGQLATPLSVNFSNAFSKNASPGYMEPARLNATGATFRELLLDLDRLLATDTAFMINRLWRAFKTAARSGVSLPGNCNIRSGAAVQTVSIQSSSASTKSPTGIIESGKSAIKSAACSGVTNRGLGG